MLGKNLLPETPIPVNVPPNGVAPNMVISESFKQIVESGRSKVAIRPDVVKASKSVSEQPFNVVISVADSDPTALKVISCGPIPVAVDGEAPELKVQSYVTPTP